MEITKEIVTYQQVLDGYLLEKDDYKLGAYTLEPAIKKTFLENPNLEDMSKCMIFFDRVDGIIGGRQMFFPTKVKIGEKIVSAQSGSSLLTVPEFRKYAIGMDMINYPIRDKEYPLIIYAGIATMAKPIYKALRFNLFEFPSYWQPRNAKVILQHFGICKKLIPILSCISNAILKPSIKIINALARLNSGRFQVQKMNKVPAWVNDIIEKDSHKYAEFHDSRWMQWTLDNNFFAKEYDSQSFYAISKDGNNLGFFMINERQLAFEERNIDRVIFGSVFEWGSIDEDILSEEQIYQIAFTYFSKNVDIAIAASNNRTISSKMRNMLAFKHGNASFIVKDLTKSYKDISDINNWRVRLGYCDCPFY